MLTFRKRNICREWRRKILSYLPVVDNKELRQCRLVFIFDIEVLRNSLFLEGVEAHSFYNWGERKWVGVSHKGTQPFPYEWSLFSQIAH